MINLTRQEFGVHAIARGLEVTPGLVSTHLREAREAGIDLGLGA